MEEPPRRHSLMAAGVGADLVLVLHLAFVAFVVAGGLAVLHYRWLAVLHLPAALWAVMLEFNGWICPLTPLEQALRRAAGEAGYAGGFVAHYLVPVIYPADLTRDIQWLLGVFVLVVNGAIYGFLAIRMIRGN